MIGAGVSAATALVSWLAPVMGMVDPAQAEKWGIQGILIAAIVALVGFIALILKWVVQKLLPSYESNTMALNRVSDALERQSEFFEGLGKTALQEKLGTPASARKHE